MVSLKFQSKKQEAVHLEDDVITALVQTDYWRFELEKWL